MAAGALRRQLLLRGGRGMAGMAIDLGVFARQREFRPRGVIELGVPVVVAVAAGAVVAEAIGVCVDGAMTTHAGLGNLVLEITGAMAGRAVERGVAPEQREAGLAQVIELR